MRLGSDIMSYAEKDNDFSKKIIKIVIIIFLIIIIIGYKVLSVIDYSYNLSYLFKYNNINKKEAKEYLVKEYGISSSQIKLKKIYYFNEICIDGCQPQYFSIDFEYNGQDFIISNETNDEHFKPNPDNWKIICVNSSECDLNGKKVNSD